MNDAERILMLYEQNRDALGHALFAAGGDPALILRTPEFAKVLRVCSQNFVVLNAKHLPNYALPEKENDTCKSCFAGEE